METIFFVIVIAFAILQIVMIVKFFQIAGDLRNIRQSIPLAAKVTKENPVAVLKVVKRAIRMGNDDYALSLLKLLKYEFKMALQSNDVADKSFIEKWLSEIDEVEKSIS